MWGGRVTWDVHKERLSSQGYQPFLSLRKYRQSKLQVVSRNPKKNDIGYFCSNSPNAIGLKMFQVGPQMLIVGPNMVPKWSPLGLKWSQRIPELSQWSLKWSEWKKCSQLKKCTKAAFRDDLKKLCCKSARSQTAFWCQKNCWWCISKRQKDLMWNARLLYYNLQSGLSRTFTHEYQRLSTLDVNDRVW